MEAASSEVLLKKPGFVDGARKSWAIAVKDMKIYYFKPAILIFGMLFPVTIFFAFMMGRNVEAVTLFPGLIALTLFFSTTTVAPFSIPWERMSKTFERLLFAPVSLTELALGKTISSLVFGLVMSIVPLLIGVILFGSSVANVLALALGIILGNACISNLGTLVSTVGSETPQNVMLLLNLVRLPMMFISGIFIPISQLPTWGRVISWFSPVSYVVDLLRRGLGFKDYFGPVISSVMLVVFGLAMFALSVLRMKGWNR